MSERYTKLFTLPANLYAEGAPVIVSAGNLLKDTQTGKVLAQLKIKNISPKTIKAAKLVIHALDTTGQPLDGDAEQEYLDLYANRGNEFGQKQAISLPNASTRGFDVDVTQVIFSDNSTWESPHAVWAPLPAAESLHQKLGDAELVKQYKIKFGGACEVAPRVDRDLWLCTCGTWNRESLCYRCGKHKGTLLPIELEPLKKDKEARLAQEQALREMKDATDKAAAKAKAKKTRLIGTVAALCLIALLIVTKVIIPNQNYNKAIALEAANQYPEAIAAFHKLGNFKDAKDHYLALCKERWHWETIAAGSWHTVGVKADGTVVAAGDNEHGQCNVSRWTDIVAIFASDFHTVGLKADGTVVATGSNKYGQCNVSSWTDIVAISVCDCRTAGLKADGTVVETGSYPYDQGNVSRWTDIVAISVCDRRTVGLKADGTVVATGWLDDYDGAGNVRNWSDIVVVKAYEDITYGVKADGTVVVAGDTFYAMDQLLPTWKDIVDIFSTENTYYSDDEVIGLKADGTVAFCDDIYWTGFSEAETDLAAKVQDWKNIVAVASGYDHLVGLKADGTVVADGDNAYGQCDVGEWKDIVAISAGRYHTVGLKADGTVVVTKYAAPELLPRRFQFQTVYYNQNYGQFDVYDWKNMKLP